MIDLKPNDRVLIVSLAGLEFVRELAGRVPDGLLVGIGTPDEVADARRALASAENVMFHAASPEEIPWRDDYFTVVISVPPESPLAEDELRRVLAPGGVVHLLLAG
jgi:SAM-dependent methyltransferase